MSARTAAVLFLLFAAGCASPRPVLYPNEQFQAAGKERAQQDVDDCMAQARQYVESQKGPTRSSGASSIFASRKRATSR